MLRISADSTCDLSQELIEKYDVGITPLYIVMDGKSYRDAIEVTPDDVYAYVDRAKKIPSTAAINVDEYLAYFGEQLKTHDGIVHFCISSEMSSCYQNACIAAREFDNVFVCDSRNLSTGIGHLVLIAAELAAKGKTAKEIFDVVEARKDKLDVSFVLDTLRYLSLGGRCSSLMALGANLLNIKPSIQVANGKMGVSKKYRCSFDRAVVRYINDKLAEPDTVDPFRIFITDSGCTEAIKDAAEEAVRAAVPFAEIYHTRAGCTISNHCGPNCIGILFFRK